jgi:hypothetical protein
MLAAEIRNAEDFRDVFERFEVVYQASTQYTERKAAFREAAAALDATGKKIKAEEGKPTWPRVQSKLVHQEAKEKMNREVALGRYKDILQRFIDAKIRYNRFKVSRMRHGWVLYAQALRTASKAEVDVFGRVRVLLEEMRCDTELPAEELPQPPESVAPEVVQAAVEAVADEVVAAADVEVTAPPQTEENSEPVLAQAVPEPEPAEDPVEKPADPLATWGQDTPDAENPFD